MAEATRKARLDPRYLPVALGPAVVFIISSILLRHAGEPHDFLPDRIAEFDMYKESAARINMLAGLLLFVGVALGALAFFFYTLRMLDRRSRLLVLIAFLVLAAAAVGIGLLAQTREAHDYVGRSLTCLAAGYDRPTSDARREAERKQLEAAPPTGTPPRQKAQPSGVDRRTLPARDYCGENRFTRIRQLGQWQFYLVALAFSGLMFGAICCLAIRPAPAGGAPRPARVPASVPPPDTAPLDAAQSDTEPVDAVPPDGSELLHWERQSQWLNTYLYLAALLLGTALVFINAYMRFPSYLLLETGTFDTLVAAAVSYYGFAFTAMLGAFYIPVALVLSNKVRALKPTAPGESKLPAAFQGPLQILKIVLGMFSTSLLGILPNILDKIGS